MFDLLLKEWHAHQTTVHEMINLNLQHFRKKRDECALTLELCLTGI